MRESAKQIRVNSKQKYFLGQLAYLIIICALLVPLRANAQDASDIWVAKLNLWEKDPITELVRISDNNHYTNQPYFFDNNRLFYTQAMPKENVLINVDVIAAVSEEIQEHAKEVDETPVQMDTWVFDFSLGKAKNISQSETSEYSPTPYPETPDMSLIRVNDLGKQELWRINMQGKAIAHLAPLIEPVGYHAWLNNKEVLLFVLGEPNTLQRVNALASDANAEVIDKNIGASLYRFEKTDWFLYTSNTDGNYLNAYNTKTKKIIQVVRMPKNSEYFSVSPLGHVITSDGETLWQGKFMMKGDKIKPLDRWQAIKIKQPECAKGISRTAISPDTSMIALVCARAE